MWSDGDEGGVGFGIARRSMLSIRLSRGLGCRRSLAVAVVVVGSAADGVERSCLEGMSAGMKGLLLLEDFERTFGVGRRELWQVGLGWVLDVGVGRKVLRLVVERRRLLVGCTGLGLLGPALVGEEQSSLLPVPVYGKG